MVGAGDRIHLQDVSLGDNLGSEVEILSGVTASDQIVANPSLGLLEGQQVKVVQAARGYELCRELKANGSCQTHTKGPISEAILSSTAATTLRHNADETTGWKTEAQRLAQGAKRHARDHGNEPGLPRRNVAGRANLFPQTRGDQGDHRSIVHRVTEVKTMIPPSSTKYPLGEQSITRIV